MKFTMLLRFWGAIGIALVTVSAFGISAEPDWDAVLNQAIEKIDAAQTQQRDWEALPRNIPNGKRYWETTSYTSWVSGFWPGILWYVYEYTGDEKWRRIAHERNASVAKILSGRHKDHDLGFQFYCSFGNGYRLTQEPLYREYLLEAAEQLAQMFNPNVGTILSWPHARERYEREHNTIIDNLMNLELLFWAAKHGGNRRYYDIAVRHAAVTLQHQIRPDFTHWHVVVYDPNTGQPVQKVTHQGYADESLWARGQAWGIYGFTMVFRETGDERFLEAAKGMAEVFLDRLPEDQVPFWDFNAPGIPNAPRDASAAAIAASGLLELSTLVDSEHDSEFYDSAAVRILKSLAEHYRTGDQNVAILGHSVGNLPKGSEVGIPIIYADYYFIEALLRKREINAAGTEHQAPHRSDDGAAAIEPPCSG